MTNRIRQESPLVARKLESLSANAHEAADVIFYERGFLGHINVRGEPSSASFVRAVRSTLRVALPLEANTFIDANDIRACWLGPNEWLVMCDGAEERARAEDLRRDLEGQFAAITEIGGGQTVLGIVGAHARDVIAKGCPLDLHPRIFTTGCCAQTSIAHSAVTILLTSAAPSFELIVRRSYADYFWGWLTDAAAEYGYTVVSPVPRTLGRLEA